MPHSLGPIFCIQTFLAPSSATNIPASTLFATPFSVSFPLFYVSGCSSVTPASSPDSLKALQGNVKIFRARSAENFYFTSLHPVAIIYIEKSKSKFNSNSSFFFPGYYVLRFDCTYFRSDILSPDDQHASCDYVGVIISLNNSSFLSFRNLYAPLFAFLQRIAEPTPSPPRSSLHIKSLHSGDFNYYHPLWNLKVLLAHVERKLNWVIYLDLHSLHDPDSLS